jgi:transcriptional regulator with XRE-family HTH domain
MATPRLAPDGQTPDAGKSSAVDLQAERAMKQLGAEIRRLRRARGHTLGDVASRAGVSTSMLSMLERGLAGASIGTLVAVSSALGVQMAELFHVDSGNSGPVQRRSDQVVVQTSPGITRRVVNGDEGNGVEMSILELEPGSDTSAKPIRHSGQEYLLVLEGPVTTTLSDDLYHLDTGDGMTFDAEQPHIFTNSGTTSARMVLVALARPSS